MTTEKLDQLLEEVENELKEAVFECEKIRKKYTKSTAKKLRRRLDKIAKLKVELRKEMLRYERE